MDLNKLLRYPAAMVAANWAGLLGLLSLVGVIPAFAGNARVMADLDEHADTSGRVVLTQLRRTLRRDLPVSLGWWVFVLVGVATGWLMVTAFDGGTRVFFAGLLVPTYWVVGALFGAYVRAAGTTDLDAHRSEVLAEATRLVLTSPLRALATVLVVIVTTPVWVLAPITIACGLSVPAWLIAKVWGPATTAAQRRARADADRDLDSWDLSTA
ncbi:hypothetical protein EXU48_05395 [Occultella glacieicola]|uniref:DUF624 domain-containing protein n=1 Tax=Occultella glacieicola TaxID=2518684 RepID=A0ABY2E7S0_9MICO|nr:hypothetical protein [Occultella glacieicola]TDE97611.1 hypothetical protein EXU48_05395 [Occultella glacieicola]